MASCQTGYLLAAFLMASYSCSHSEDRLLFEESCLANFHSSFFIMSYIDELGLLQLFAVPLL